MDIHEPIPSTTTTEDEVMRHAAKRVRALEDTLEMVNTGVRIIRACNQSNDVYNCSIPIDAFNHPIGAFNHPFGAFNYPIGAFNQSNDVYNCPVPIDAFNHPIGAFNYPIGACAAAVNAPQPASNTSISDAPAFHLFCASTPTPADPDEDEWNEPVSVDPAVFHDNDRLLDVLHHL